MSIYDTNVIDFISIQGNKVSLVLTDQLKWTDNNQEDKEQIQLLQSKINKYIAFYESGEIFVKKPEAKDKYIAIEIVAKYCPNKIGAEFIYFVRNYLATSDCNKLGLEFIWADDRKNN